MKKYVGTSPSYSGRTADEIYFLKTWAEQYREELRYKGKLRGEIIHAWQEAHKDLDPIVVSQWYSSFGRGGTPARAVKVLCYICARFHTYILTPGIRQSPYSVSEVKCTVICSRNNKGKYTFVDTLPLMKWEIEYLENKKIKYLNDQKPYVFRIENDFISKG
jgi:hypothetical protein